MGPEKKMNILCLVNTKNKSKNKQTEKRLKLRGKEKN